MGGKNPLLVLDDTDLDIALIVQLTGRSSRDSGCNARRIIVTEGIHDEFVDEMTHNKQARGRRCSRPGDQIGPLALSREMKSHFLTPIAQQEGASRATGGETSIQGQVSIYSRHCLPEHLLKCGSTVKKSSDRLRQ